MPELPEVQTLVDDLNRAGLCNAVIDDVQIYWSRTIATCSVKAFRRQIRGTTIKSILRRAKFIVIELSNGLFWLVHLRMTGRFQIESGNGCKGRHVRAVIALKDRRFLVFFDTRKFGRFYLTPTPESILGNLGPEPLSSQFTSRMLSDRIGVRRTLIKPLLLDQKFISGLGNIYADEALWAAKIHPKRPASSLSAQEIMKLHRAIRHVLRQGIRNAGTSLGTGMTNFNSIGRSSGRNATKLKVFRRTGKPCLRCADEIVKIVVAQRSTHLCAQCQRID